MLFLMVILILLTSLVSCGGGKSGATLPDPQSGPQPGTPAAAYSVGLTATVNQITHTIPVTVIVK